MKKKILSAAVAAALTFTSLSAVCSAVEKVDALSGDLTVTDFFKEKTNAIELKDGVDYQIKFNVKTAGDQNYHNFILAIATPKAVEGDYPGAPEEIAIIRADNWGWGGGASDFLAPDAKEEGNKLKFETDIDWGKWMEGAKAGYDVDITVKKKGDTIDYNAKIGSYSVKLQATSGKKLPDTVYAFLTGDKCVLTGISSKAINDPDATTTTTAPAETTTTAATTAAGGNTANGTDNKGNANTGVEGVAAVAALAIITAGAVVIAKKRK